MYSIQGVQSAGEFRVQAITTFFYPGYNYTGVHFRIIYLALHYVFCTSCMYVTSHTHTHTHTRNL